MNKITQLQKLIDNAQRIVVMTGAGFSTASKIPDFRSDNGLYMDDSQPLAPEAILSHHFFIANPKTFYKFYLEKMVYPDALPNIGHKKLVEIEESGKKITIITQNIDGLHQKAGSTNVVELHGSVFRNYCMKCHKFYSLDEVLTQYNLIPKCHECGGMIKPDVVLYEEELDNTAIDQAIKAIISCDLLLIIGSSMVVNPARTLPYYYRGHNMVIINLTETPLDGLANLIIRERSEIVLEQIKIRKE